MPSFWSSCYVPRRIVTYSIPTCYVAPTLYSYPTYNVSTYYSYPTCATSSSCTLSSIAPLASSAAVVAPASWSSSDSLLTRLASAYPGGSSYQTSRSNFSDPAFVEIGRIAGGGDGGGATIADRSATIARSANRDSSASDSSASDSQSGVKLVSASNSAPIEAVPHDLLSAADSIFSAGGFRDAAMAYARLSVRYGVSSELTTRRFVALVASGDIEQAAVVVESSAAAGVSINPAQLPGSKLSSLYGPQVAKLAEHGESLARYALEHADQSLPLVMVGTWLELDGQSDRGRKFFERASQMSDSPEVDLQPLLASTRVTH